MVGYHFVRGAVQERDMQLEYCLAEVMVADMLTKALAKDRFEMLRERLLSGSKCQVTLGRRMNTYSYFRTH
jgi:hypothetical protein